MNLKIRHKLEIGFGIILVFFIAIIGINNIFISDTNKSVKDIKNNINKQVEYAATIKTSVIEVQQWITDAALTKSQNSMKEAENYRQKFIEASKALESINPEHSDKIAAMGKDFEAFYQIGLKMAQVYNTEGLVQGNKLMDQFDPATEKITGEVHDLEISTSSLMQGDLSSISNKLSLANRVGVITGVMDIIIAIFIVMLLAGKITKQTNKLLHILNDLESGDGDLTKRIKIDTKDEIGMMAHAFNRFMDNLENMISGVKVNAREVAGGTDLLNQGTKKTKENSMVVNKRMEVVSQDTLKISNSISEMTASISGIADSAENTAQDTQKISGVAENINVLAKNSGKLALDAKDEMEKIKKISSETMELSVLLGNEAKEIGKIIDTIKEITDQTNLLALNASIEAARAGEQGRGFGVVAEEIRKLAETNSVSAKNIEEIIKNIQQLIDKTIRSTSSSETNIIEGSKIVEEVYIKLNQIIEDIGGINGKIQNIAAATEEQSATTSELSLVMEEINSSNIKIEEAVEEIAASIEAQVEIENKLDDGANKLKGSSEDLNKLINRFKLREE